MPNVHLTEPMQEYARHQIDRGAYANLSEVVRAGMRLLMEQDGVRAYRRLKAELEASAAQIDEAVPYDPDEFR